MSEPNFQVDFSVDADGRVHGLDPVAYQYGERYVKCRKCVVSRPGHEMVIWHGVPVCSGHIEYVRPNELSRQVPEVRQLQVAVHLPTRQQDPGQDRSFVGQTDAPICRNCGEITVRSGTCHKCLNCGETSGCS